MASSSKPEDSKPQPQKRAKKQPTAKEFTESKTKEATTPEPSNPKEEASSQPKEHEYLQVWESTGDIFAAPTNTLIVHACNCGGSWAAGIAKAFKDRYPKAYKEHYAHCNKHGHSLLDSAQLIAAVDGTRASKNTSVKHFVGCLFTSRQYGRKKDSPKRILEATKPAMQELLHQVNEWNAKADPDNVIEEVRMCKINSGLFDVPWEKTKEILEDLDVTGGEIKVVKVISPPS